MIMKNYFDIKGKNAVVTGASSGIGAQWAKALASQGVNVAIVARRAERLEENKKYIEKEYGVKCIAVPCDITDEEQIKNMAGKVLEEFGNIDILVNNAGVVIKGAFLDQTTEDWDKVLNTNLKSIYLVTKYIVPNMIENKYGKIINTSSIGGVAANKGQVGYYTSKAGVINLTRALAAEFAPYAITVNAIGPGVYDTEMTHEHLSGEFAKHIAASLPLGKWGDIDDMDGILIYFASDASKYCTGQNILIDGGKTSML